MKRYVFFAALCCTSLIVAEDVKDLWLKHFIPKNYSKNNPPVKLTGPAEVNCYIVPKIVTHMLMKNMEFVVDAIIFISWFDDRLNMPGKQDVTDSNYALPQEYGDRVWVPHFLFYNSKGHDSRLIGPKTTKYLTHGYFTTNNPLHLRVFYRKSFHFICNFNFYAYPFDKQECQMMMVSALKSHQVRLNISNFFPGNTFKNITIPPEFRLRSFEEQNCILGSYDNKRFICLRFVFVFHRIYAHQMMIIFIPSILIVILSWISFWIKISASAPRVTLGLTSLLTLATQFNSAQKDLPSVADVKGIDIWMFTCMLMVFASLVEFAIANYYQEKPKSVYMPRYIYGTCKPPIRNKAILSKFKVISKAKKKLSRRLFCSSSTNRIDLAARLMFPVFFLVFNTVFWIYFVGKR